MRFLYEQSARSGRFVFGQSAQRAAVEQDPARSIAQRMNPVGAEFSRLLGGGDRGLPPRVYEAARQAGCLGELESRFPPPGVSAVSNALAHMEQRMRAPLDCYIGITEAPVQRLAEHLSQSRFRAHRRQLFLMSLVEEAESSGLTAATERAIIAEAVARWGERCRNGSRGGDRPSAGSPHYCYVIWFR